MKKSVKILTLVLSLAILCGALVVAAFADGETDTTITGIVLDNAADFEGTNFGPGGETIPTAESAGEGTKSTDIDKDDGAARVVTIKHQKGGQPVVLVNPNDNNSYFTVDWSQNPNTSSGHFFDTYHKDGRWGVWKDEANAPIYGSKIMYAVLDVDMMWENPADYDGTGFFYPYLGYTTESGGFKNLDGSVGIRFVKGDNGTVAVKIQNSDKQFKIGSDGVWSHVTFVMGFEVIGEEGAKNVAVKQYLAVDGVILDTFEFINTVDASTVWGGDKTRLYARDVRFNAFGQSKTAAMVDNYTLRSVTPEYNGNLATVLAGGVGTDLTTWESNIYDADKMPFGELVATIGTAKYDTIQKAIAAAEEGDTITLCKDIDESIVLDKAITIECGEYKFENLSAEKGLMATYDKETKTWTVETAQGEFYITWESCTCGLEECDETHPGGFESTGWAGGTLASAYTEEEGKIIDWTYSSGYDTYTLIGWEDEEGNFWGFDTVITPEMCEDITEIVLYPVLAKTSATLTYVKKGETVALSGDTALQTALSGMDAGTTITLLSDARFKRTTAYTLGKDITINLNGNILNALVDVKFSSGVINLGGKTLTILGEEEGSAFINAYPLLSGDKLSKAAGTAFGGAGTLNMKGSNLFVSTAAFYGNWGTSTVAFNFEGITYNNNGGSDNPADLYHKGKATVNIKNCLFKTTNPFIGFTNDQGNVVTIENSAFVGGARLVNGSYPKVAVVIKDSYISGQIPAEKGITVIGENNYFCYNDWAKNATFDDGVSLAQGITKKTFDLADHPWIIGADKKWDEAATTVVTVAPYTQEYTYKTTKTPISAQFYDGETLLNGYTTYPGAKLLAYDAPATAIADGWVNESIKYWYTVDAAATEAIKVDIKDITDKGISYSAGTPKLYVNYKLSDNLTTNLYVPKELPEGVEISAIYLAGTDAPRTLSGNFTIGGKTYATTQAWPTAWGADEGKAWTVNYTYGGAEMSYKVQPNVVSYAKQVEALYGEDTAKMQQVVAILQYVEAANNIKANTLSNGISEYLDELQAKVTIPTPTTVYVSNLANLKAYLKGAKVTINANRGGSMVFTVSDEALAEGVKVVFKVGEYTIPTTIDATNKTVTFDNSELVNWTASDITIEVIKGEGEAAQVLATGTYGLAAYKDEMADSMTADEIALLDAMYALGFIGNTNN